MRRVHGNGQARLAAWMLAVFLLAGCSANATSFHVDAVSPSQVAVGAGAKLLISGGGFQQGDKVSIGSATLEDVVWVSEGLLSANLPTSLTPGRYNVVVADPSGRQVTKSSALQVSPPVATRTPSPTPTPTAAPKRPTPTPTPVPTVATAVATESPTPRAQAPQLNVSGVWRLVDTIIDGSTGQPTSTATFSNLVLQQQGDRVTGGGNGISSLQGTLTGNVLEANYLESDGSSGTFEWTFSSDGTSFSGRFTNSRPNGGTSQGTFQGALSGQAGAERPAAPRVLVPPQQPARAPTRPGPQRHAPNGGGLR